MYQNDKIPYFSCEYVIGGADKSDFELKIHDKNGKVRSKALLNKKQAEWLIESLQRYLGLEKKEF